MSPLYLGFETIFKDPELVSDKEISCEEECDSISGPCVDCQDCNVNCEECESSR